MRKLRTGLVAVGLLALGVGTASPGAAAPKDPNPRDKTMQVSATSGPPGTSIVVDTTCYSNVGYDAQLTVRLYSGAPGQEKLAGYSSDFQESVVIIVPDWVDPAQPAHLEGTCDSFDTDTEEFTSTDLDPVDFDITPGVGPRMQTLAFSRTTLRVGQAFNVSSNGCTLTGAEFAEVHVVPGNDLRGDRFDETVAGGGDVVDGTSFSVDTLVASNGYSFDQTNDGPVTIGEDFGSDLTPGTYTVFVQCETDSGDESLLFEPQLIQVTAGDPAAVDDLVVGPGPRQVTLAGKGCTSDSVDVELASFTDDDLNGSFDDGSDPSGDPSSNLSGDNGDPVGDIVDQLSQQAMDPDPSATPTFEDGFLDASVATTADGSWTITVTVPADAVAIAGDATCGDPLADGFVYATQVVNLPPVVTLPDETRPKPPASTVRPPAPATPARAVTGSARYTG